MCVVLQTVRDANKLDVEDTVLYIRICFGAERVCFAARAKTDIETHAPLSTNLAEARLLDGLSCFPQFTRRRMSRWIIYQCAEYTSVLAPSTDL